MKILAFTDVHTNKKLVRLIAKKASGVDLLICSGDLSYFGEGLNESIKELLKAKKKILIIFGNHELEEQITELENKYDNVIDIHKKPFHIGGYTFVGYGGDGFSIHDKKMEKYFSSLSKKLNKVSKLITVTHAPPGDTRLDVLPHLGHVGNLSITKGIIDLKPILHLCGHLHENFGKKDRIGRTLIVNPGCDGKILDI